MSTVIVSAPGKIHLMGEHAVVHGKPALLTAINLRLQVTIESAEKGLDIEVDDIQAKEFIQYAIDTVQKEYNISKLPPMNISLTSEIPFGYHLGSSASLAVATVGAVLFYVKELWNPQEINRLAYEVEKKQHGNPSGGDNTSVTYGGFLWYRRELEFLKSMWQIPLRLAPELTHFMLVNTGKPIETTGEMVELVAQKIKKEPEVMKENLLLNEEATKSVASSIKYIDETMLIQALQKGEKTLEAMGVVSELVKPFIHDIEQHGGAAKILGGGGKKQSVGFLLVYHHDPKKVEEIAQKYGFSLQEVTLGEEGVRLESGKK